MSLILEAERMSLRELERFNFEALCKNLYS